MDELIFASLSHTHYYWYEVSMLVLTFTYSLVIPKNYNTLPLLANYSDAKETYIASLYIAQSGNGLVESEQLRHCSL